MFVGGRRQEQNDLQISIKVIYGDSKTRQFPSLPDTEEIRNPEMICLCGPSLFMQNKTILVCGIGKNAEKCFRLDNDSWIEHSILTMEVDLDLQLLQLIKQHSSSEEKDVQLHSNTCRLDQLLDKLAKLKSLEEDSN